MKTPLSTLPLILVLGCLGSCAVPSILAENGWPLQASREAPARDWRYGAYGQPPGTAPAAYGQAHNPYQQPQAHMPQGQPPMQGQPYGMQAPVNPTQQGYPGAQQPYATQSNPYGNSAAPTQGMPSMGHPQQGYPPQQHGAPMAQGAAPGMNHGVNHGVNPGANPGMQAGMNPAATRGSHGGDMPSLPNFAGATQSEPEPPLLGWDGGVVEGRKPGEVEEVDPARGIEPSPGGRMRIIELYSQVLDERDALAEEVEQLRDALERSNSIANNSAADRGDLDRRVQELELENASLKKDKADLVARLVTAQIRRLESDKILVESRIDALRRQKANQAVPMRSPQTRGEDGR